MESALYAPCCGGVPECAICLSLLCHPLCLPCEHAFCRQCLVQAFLESRACPLCRKEVEDPSFDPATEPMHAPLENFLRRSCTMEYAQRLIDSAAEAARTVWLHVNNTHEVGIERGRPMQKWSLSISIGDSGDWHHARRTWEPADLIEKVEFSVAPGCRIWSSEKASYVPQHTAMNCVRGPCFEVRGLSIYLFTVHLVIHWKDWLSLLPVALEHGLTSKGCATTHGVDLGEAASHIAEGLGDAKVLAQELLSMPFVPEPQSATNSLAEQGVLEMHPPRSQLPSQEWPRSRMSRATSIVPSWARKLASAMRH